MLFKISPSDKVSKTNGDELVVPTGVPEPVGISELVAGEKDPEATLVTNREVPPCAK